MDMMLEQFKIIFDRPEKVKKLRETILNLAVRGKLVSQDPNDEPASILLERIKEEKERLIKEKKIKKEYCDDIISQDDMPYFIPSGWEWARLIDLGTYKKGPFGSAITKNMFIPKSECTIKVYEQKNAIQKNIELGDYYISEEYFNQKLSGFEVFAGDILVSCAGTIGETYIVPENAERGIINQALMKMRIFNGLSIDYFLMYFDYILKKSAIEKSNGSAMKNIPPFSIFKKMLVAIPPIEEQKRIVEKVNLLMDFCDKLEKSLEKKINYEKLSAKSVFNAVGNVSTFEELEETLKFILLNFKDLSLGDNSVKELKNCILQLAVQGKLVPQDLNEKPAEVLLEKIREEKERLIKEKKIKKEKPLAEIDENEKPFELPSGWKWVRLKEIGYSLGQKKPDVKFTYIDVGSINKEKGEIGEKLMIINPENAPSRARKLVDRGTIIYSTVRPYLLNIAIIDKEFEFEPIVSTAFAIIHPYKGINSKYVLYYLRSTPFIKYVESQMVGMAYPAINDEKFYSGLFPMPPLEEQNRIVEKVESLLNLCDKLDDSILKYKKYNEKLANSIIKNI